MSTFSRFVSIGAIAALTASAGAQEVQRVIGNTQAERLLDIQPAQNAAGVFDGFIAVGWRDFGTAAVNRDFWAVRTAPDGTIIWSVRFGGPGRDEAFKVVQTPDLGFAIVGEQTSLAQPLGLGIVKLDFAGNFVWSRALIGGGFIDNVLNSIQRPAGVSVANLRPDQLGIVSYWRPNLAAATEVGVFYRLDSAGNFLVGFAYSDATQTPSRLAFADIRELSPTPEIAVIGTRGRIFTPLPGGLNLDPVFVRLAPNGVVNASVFFDNSAFANLPDQETGEGLTVPPNTTAIPNVFFNGYARWSNNLGTINTGMHVQRLEPFGLFSFWKSRFARFNPTLAAIDPTRPFAGVVIAGSVNLFAGGSSPAMMNVDEFGQFAWARAYRGAAATAAITGEATGVCLIPTLTLGYALSGFVLTPPIFGSDEGLFIRTNSFGLTGCPENQLFFNTEEAPTNPNTLPITIQNSDTTIWQATWARVGTQTVFCASTGCCNLADITSIGGLAPPCDGQLTVDDVILFFNEFGNSVGCPGPAPCNIADVTGIGGAPGLPDGQLTVDDIIAFTNAFSDGCP